MDVSIIRGSLNQKLNGSLIYIHTFKGKRSVVYFNPLKCKAVSLNLYTSTSRPMMKKVKI